MFIIHCHVSEKSSKAVNQIHLVTKPICTSVKLQDDAVKDNWQAVRLFTVPFFSVRLSRSCTHRQWQPFCNWFQMYRGGRGSGFMVMGDIFLAPPKSFPAPLVVIFELASVKMAACSARSQRSYVKIGDNE